MSGLSNYRWTRSDTLQLSAIIGGLVIAIIYIIVSMSAHKCTQSHFYQGYSSKEGSYKAWACDKHEWSVSKQDQDFMTYEKLEKTGIK